MNGESLNIREDNLQKLKELFPDVFSEEKLDWEKLKATFSEDINFANERYVLNWAGKGDAFKTLQIPTTATLKPAPEDSINFDTTQNVFIEGENLEVLKVLQKSYYGKIKCIIIDPPYNTGNDSFIYPDSFKENKADYEKRVGDKDEEGYLMKEGLFRKNSKDSGHFHSNWLSMMYPRLFLAKNLLNDDGVIFVHIDDNEVHNLRLLMNEIFGEENFVGQIIIETATDNNPSLVANEHEYVLIYSKNIGLQSAWRKPSLKAQLLQSEYLKLKSEFHIPFKIESELRKWIKKNKEKIEGIEHYDNVDDKGVFHDADIANPKFGGYFYDVIHPITNKPCKIPEKGFRYPKETLMRLVEEGNVMFGENETTLIKPKKRLEKAKEIFRSVIYNDGRASTKRLSELIGRDIFKYSKDEILQKNFLSFVTKSNDIVLDFFAGSATTAQAVLELNREDGGNRKFILVQLPELTDENSEAYKAGYKTIADISKERIRRVIKKIEKEKAEINKERESELKFGNHENQDNQKNKGSDNGFKVFKLASSNFKIWRGNEITEENLVQQLEVFTNPVSEGSLEKNMLYELMLKAGYRLTDKVEATNILWDNFDAGGEINYYSIADNELIIILDGIDESTVLAVINAKPKKIITLDSLFTGNDQLKTNTVLQMRDAGVEFKTI